MTAKLRADFPSLASREQVARELDVSPRQVDRLRDEGALTVVKVGSRVRITRDSLAAYIESRPSA